MNRRLFASLLCGCLVAAMRAQSSYSLQMCIDYAIAHSLEVKDYDERRKDADWDVRMERNKRLPVLSARMVNGVSMGFQPVLTKEMAGKYESVSSYSNSFVMSVSMPIWSVEAQRQSLRLKRKNVALADLGKEEKKLSLKKEITQKYYTALLAMKRMDIAMRQLALQDSILQVSERMCTLGLRAQKDVLDAKLNREQDKYALLQEQNSFAGAMLNLKNTMRFEGELTICENPDSHLEKVIMSLHDAYEQLKCSHPDARAMEMQVNMTLMQRKTVLRQRYPSLIFNYEAGTNGMQNLTQSNTPIVSQWKNNAYQAAMLTLQIPLFNRGEVKAQLRKLDIAKERALLSFQDSQQLIHDELSAIFLDIQQSEDELRQAERTETVSRQQFDKALKDYKLGNIPSYELNVYKAKNMAAHLQTSQARITLKYKQDMLRVILE